MAIINVMQQEAVPQIETGNGFTIILRADGTVWRSSEISKKDHLETDKVIQILFFGSLTQVKINENTPLTNIIKIAVRNRPCISINKVRKCLCMGKRK